jgi:hypothetical protein
VRRLVEVALGIVAAFAAWQVPYWLGEAWPRDPWAFLWVAPVAAILTFVLSRSRIAAVVGAVVLGAAVVARLWVVQSFWRPDPESDLGTIAGELLPFLFGPRAASDPPFHVTALIALTGAWLVLGLAPRPRTDRRRPPPPPPP